MAALINTRTIKGRVVARRKSDGSRDKALVTYYVD
jgi:hypothetical protein